MQDAGIHLPSRAGFQAVSAGVEQNSVVALVPILETPPDVVLGGAGFETHEGVGEIVFGEVVLGREIVSFGFAALAHQLGLGVTLVHVVGDGSHVVEELAEEIPSAFARHDIGAQQEIACVLDRVLEEKSLIRTHTNVAQTLMFQSGGTVGSFNGGGKPSFVDSASVSSKGVQIVGMEFQSPAGDHKGTRDPAGLQAEDSVSSIQCFLNRVAIRHWCVLPT